MDMDVLRSVVFARHDLPPDTPQPDDYSHLRAGTPFSARELRDAFGECVEGTGVQVGIHILNSDLDLFEANSVPLIGGWIDETRPGESFTIVLDLEPNPFETPGPPQFRYVTDHLHVVERLGERLGGLMDLSALEGKELRAVVRYAPGMNGAGSKTYSGLPELFVSSYRAVRRVLREACPKILSSFSPCIGAGDCADVVEYWPGQDYVDLVGCEWRFVEWEEAFERSAANLDAYFRGFATLETPPCVDALAGCVDVGPFEINEPVYQAMRRHLAELRIPGLALEHVAYDLSSYWGAGVGLKGLCS